MSEELAAALDLDLGWRRVLLDSEDRLFVKHPYETALVELDRGAWLDALREALRTDHYAPSPMSICDVPKGDGSIRPGGLLTLADRVVYAACVGACLPAMQTAMRGGATDCDFGLRLRGNSEEPRWTRSRFEGWDLFRKKTLAGLEQGFSHLLISDLSGYYENIDIATLISDLRQAAAPFVVLGILQACLNRWAVVGGRGVPQGHSASDMLAKLYLNAVDQNLLGLGIKHVRYVDDYRLFCRSRVEAKRAFVQLIRLLRRRGLNVHAGKSRIHRADAAKTIVEDVAPVLDTIRKKFIREIAAIFDMDASGLSVADADGLLKENPEEAPLTVIREAFKAFFVDEMDGQFRKTLFHFLLGRLGKAKDRYALDYCQGILESHPEETEAILRYFRACEAERDVESSVARFAASDDAIYPYQLYQITDWRRGFDGPVDPSLLAVARRSAFDGGQPLFLRAACGELLAVHGTVGDLERIEVSYPDAQGDLERATLICALRRMEPGRRNAFLGRVQADGDFCRRASRWVRSAGQ